MSVSDHPATRAQGKIMIVGGYGQVGQLIAEQLVPVFPGRLVIAGRRRDKAVASAARIGNGTTGRAFDVTSGDMGSQLEDVALVLVCLDQAKTGFVEQCLSRGIDYLDVTASYEFQRQVSAFDLLAKHNGATAVLSVGVAPGLTNLVAAQAASAMDRTDRIDIFVQIGLGDHHGEAAIAWMLDNLDATYEVREAGRPLQVRGFSESRSVRFSGQRGVRAAYRFSLSDQQVLPLTLNVPSVSTWLCFDSRFMTWMVALAARAGLGRLLRKPRWRKTAIWLFQNLRVGSDICAIAVRAAGKTRKGDPSLELGVTGHAEALMTAVIAAELAQQALSADLGSGVFHSEQVIAFEPVLSALKQALGSSLIVSGPFMPEEIAGASPLPSTARNTG